MLKESTKVNDDKINTNKKSPKSYMNSYDWNYMVLEIVDYLEETLNQVESLNNPDTDLWKNFKNYCTQNNLNWRVIKKMIEFSINTPFESERELANHESFKALEKVKDEPVEVLENFKSKSEKVLKSKIKEIQSEVDIVF